MKASCSGQHRFDVDVGWRFGRAFLRRHGATQVLLEGEFVDLHGVVSGRFGEFQQLAVVVGEDAFFDRVVDANPAVLDLFQ